MSVSLVGNPFVDTGLAVLAFKSGCENLTDLTLEKIKKVHGDGTELANRNSRLKSTSMIFTINSLITHPGIKPVERRVEFYSKITTAILNKIGFEDVDERCESCGNARSLDIDKLVRETLVPLGYKDDKRYTGRDWFPLAGSIGSDAQALPAGSRTPNLCAKCLFAVHYLPQGVVLRDGRLAVFQSTSQTFWYLYVSRIAEEIENRIRAGKFETLGSKEGSIVVVEKTIETMRRMKSLDAGTSLFVWLFSNSGTGPDCSIDEIPNSALQFLFNVITRVPTGREEIIRLIRKDKNPEYSFLNCISTGKDYYWLYPSKKFEGVSPAFFLLYQTEIRKASKHALLSAFKIARYLRENLPTKDLEKCKKNLTSDFAEKNTVRKYIVEMVEKGFFNFEDYSALFVHDSNMSIGINNDAWRYISYYLYHEDCGVVDEQVNSKSAYNELQLYVARTIFDDQLQTRGITRFRNEVLAKFNLGKISTSWLRRQFLKAAIRHEGFNYETWKALCLNEEGKETTYELLFRFRLMWTEWLRTNDLPKIVTPAEVVIPRNTDLPPDVEQLIFRVSQDYITMRGLSRFKKDVVEELVSGEKTLYWFKEKFAAIEPRYSDEEYWERFCSDENGNSIRNLRLFQLSLLLINYFRELCL
ncbi:MAG: hypothetical protein ACQXXJ_02485 [Candidatus Bathyarchaeia archaeon]|jgi:CRISPR-associated protein Cst1